MDRNPYAPPAAAVADPIKVREKRPREVIWAMILVWAWLVMSMADSVLSIAIGAFNTSLNVISMLLLVALPIGIPAIIVAWINGRIGAGHRWARILTSVGLGASVVHTAQQWHVYLAILAGKMPLTFFRTSQLLALLLAAITVALLFTPRANRWFKPKA
jgi:hypothetical protein